MSHVSTLSFPISVFNPIKIGFSLQKLLILSGIFAISLFAFYVFQVNSLTKEVYTIKNYEKDLVRLSQENEDLEINFSKSSSFVNLDAYLQTQTFEKTATVKYIPILENQVAAK